MSATPQSRFARSIFLSSLSAAIVAVIVYWLTAYRTITWWDTSEYSLAAQTLGVAHPPGSLLTVLLGWLVTRLPLGLPKMVVLNCFSGVLAAATAAVVCGLALRLYRHHQSLPAENHRPLPAILVGFFAAVATLTFSFGDTLWSYAIRFTPYTLTPLFTGLILWTLLVWWRRADQSDSLRWLLAAMLLLGLDFSIHRTNFLLLPALIVWVLLRRPQLFLSLRAWVYAIVSFIVGLAFSLINIPLAARDPALNANNPGNWSGFWDYFTLKMYGGGMLVDLWPRKAPFFSSQLTDYLKIVSDNFAHFSGSIIVGILPILLVLTGLWFLWRRERRLAVAMIVLYLFTSIVGVIYFNTPANFFRSMDRHYLPSLLILSVWMVYGICALLDAAWQGRGSARKFTLAVIGAVAIAMPLHQVIHNYDLLDYSDNYFTYDFARNCLSCLPENAVVFVNGDNDTYPLWYLQYAEGFRTDVIVLNRFLFNTTWYVRQQLRRHPNFPLRLTEQELEQLRPVAWHDSNVVIPVSGRPADFDLPDSVTLPDSIRLDVKPPMGASYLLPGDQLILRLLKDNDWKLPICFLVTTPMDESNYLFPYAQNDGLFYRIVPVPGSQVDIGVLKLYFLHGFNYRGYDDPSVPLDPVSRMMGMNYCTCIMQLMFAQGASGDTLGCAETLVELKRLLPADRLDWPQGIRQGVEQLCGMAAEAGKR